MRHIFDEVVLFMDCCREDNTTSAPRRLTFNRSKALRPPGPLKPFCAFATLCVENARENTTNAVDQVRGIFTETLMRGLRGDARSGNQVTAELSSMPNTQLPPELDYDRRREDLRAVGSSHVSRDAEAFACAPRSGGPRTASPSRSASAARENSKDVDRRRRCLHAQGGHSKVSRSLMLKRESKSHSRFCMGSRRS